MKAIPLSVGGPKHSGKYVALVDDVDYEWLSQYRWVVKINRLGLNPLVYAFRTMWAGGTPRNIRMHREIYERVYGPIAKWQEIDHREHGEFGGLDNRRNNLRLAPHQVNRGNGRRSSNNTSGFKGTYWYKPRQLWKAQICIKQKSRHLGYFATKEEAALAYDHAALSEWGEFARLNFPAHEVAL